MSWGRIFPLVGECFGILRYNGKKKRLVVVMKNSFFCIMLADSYYEKHAKDGQVLNAGKSKRVYTCIRLPQYKGLVFAIPFRSHCWRSRFRIEMPMVGKPERGMDFTKTAVFRESDLMYSDNFFTGLVRNAGRAALPEYAYDMIVQNQGKIFMMMNKYINAYVHALQHPDVHANENLLKYSSFQHFQGELKDVIEQKLISNSRKEAHKRIDALFDELEKNRGSSLSKEEMAELGSPASLRPNRKKKKMKVKGRPDGKDGRPDGKGGYYDGM